VSDLIHGGDLISASVRYGIPVDNWLDLSTGINPCAYPLPPLSVDCFQRLPYQKPAFDEAVIGYYGHKNFLACSGSQQVIECLPDFLPALTVLLPEIGYQEHRQSWKKHGYECCFYSADNRSNAVNVIEQRLSAGKPFHLVVINPNNPTGLCFTAKQLLAWAERMPKGGHIIIDEAFIDLSPEQSVLSYYDKFLQLDNLLVLRSFGKFFGLAGIRLGFLFGAPDLIHKIASQLGPWAVNGPAQEIAIAALSDQGWQVEAREKVQQNSEATFALFTPLIEQLASKKQAIRMSASGTESLFGLYNSWWIETSTALALYEFFAQRGVLLRVITERSSTAEFADYSLVRSGIIDKHNSAVVDKLQQVIDEYILTLN